jgi:hypothetical protein
MLIAIGGCELGDTPCDPGQTLDHGLCYPAAPDASNMDAGDDDDAGGPGDASADPFAGFGDECSEQSECAPYGLVCGMSFLPYCTRTNCTGVPNGCPGGWTCLDTTGLSPDPSVTSICLRP